eukprot:TRINITY_DN6750_c0_g1_i1.p1 TRINITY_DN6750_c0_g1~~TRINITY_DN6750_c0_g1_i1.p1  ORF type:complete len:294 (-),score=21.82 TRINITY_DN6750_c0_g1_i1:61-942(-)
MEEGHKKFESDTFAAIFFWMAGFGSLSPWNAFITAFDFFEDRYPNHDVRFWFPIPAFACIILLNIFLFLYSKLISLGKRIYFGMLITGLCLILIPLDAAFIEHDLSLILMYVILFFFGIAKTIYIVSFNGLIAMFPPKYIAIFFGGTGFAGVLMNLLRMLCLVVFPSDRNGFLYGTIIYLASAGFSLILLMVMYAYFRNTDFCKYHMLRAKDKTDEVIEGVDVEPIDGVPHESSSKSIESLLQVMQAKSTEEGKKSLDGKKLSVVEAGASKTLRVFKKIYPNLIHIFLSLIHI